MVFQKNKSTSHAILDVLQHVSTAIKEDKQSCCVFLDLAKAFDTVNHKILLHKLSHYGIRGPSQKWFQSYLHSRKQSVSLLNFLSSPEDIKTGVPQSSVLGPLLFILYINDVIKSSNTLNIIQFADDTCLFLKMKHKSQLEKNC